MQRVVPTLSSFDTTALFGAIHYFPAYEEVLGLLADVTQESMYVEFCFAEGQHDTTEALGAIRPYTRSRSGTTIYMGDPETISRLIQHAIPEFNVEDRTVIRAPGRKLIARREVWRLRRR
jgi:hypothetical protein